MAASRRDAERELAEQYQAGRDVSDFDQARTVPLQTRRDVTISVRFSAEEIEQLRVSAGAADEKITAHIRRAALEGSAPGQQRAAVSGRVDRLEADVARLRRVIA